MFRDHSFRKANISVGVAASVMFVGFVTFGHDASDVGYQLLIWVSFATFFVSLFLLYRHEGRRSGSGSSRGHSKSPDPSR